MASVNIFISYRRDDAMGHAGRLFDRLVQRFGKHSVFRDVDTLSAGVDFADAIRERIARSDVVLVLIGKRWLSATDDEGRLRLSNERDFVRIEVASALARSGIKVVPVLVQDAQLPEAARLPGELAALANRHAVELRDSSFDRDVEDLVQRLGVTRGWSGALRWGLGAGAGIVLLIGTWRMASDRVETKSDPADQAHALQTAAQPASDAKPELVAPARSSPLTSKPEVLERATQVEPTPSPDNPKPVDTTPSPSAARQQLVNLGIAFKAEALVDAAKRGDEEAVRLLLIAGIPADEVVSGVDLDDEISNATPLLAAAFGGRAGVVKQLLAQGAQAARAVDGYRPLEVAASFGHTAALSALLKAQFSQTDLDSARFQAAVHLKLSAVTLLEKLGATRTDSKCDGAFAVLHVSGAVIEFTKEKQTAMLRHFLDAGCASNSRNDKGTPMLTIAAWAAANSGAVKLLIARGADVNAHSTQQQESALDVVVLSGDPNIAKLLLDAGADPNLPAKDGLTPRERAHKYSSDAMKALFQPPASRDERGGLAP